MESDAIAAPDDHIIGHLVGESDTGSEELLAAAHAHVLGQPALSADQDLIRGGIIRFDPHALSTRPGGVNLPAQSKVEGQLRD